MDRASMRPKPIPPPKPSTRLSGQNGPEHSEKEKPPVERLSSGSRALSSDQIYSEISESNKNEASLFMLNNKTEEEDWVASAIEPQNAATLPAAILSPKPPLLPKPPVLTPVIKPMSTQQKNPSFRPTVPRRPEKKEPYPITSNKLVNSRRNVGLPPLTVKAPVAKLEEFEGWYEKKVTHSSPVRPPRSPKTKLFLEGPFENVDIKPELPVKKRLLLAANDNGKNWENAKKRSSSLGRSGNTTFLQGSDKSASLGRNLSLNEQLALCTPKAGPVPPPRRRNKSEEIPRLVHFFDSNIDTKANVPIYAAVNYEMKKNRRAKVKQTLSPSLQLGTRVDDPVFSDEVDSVVEGRLLLGNNEFEKTNNNCMSSVETTLLSRSCEALNLTTCNPYPTLLSDGSGKILEANASKPSVPSDQVEILLFLHKEERLDNQSTSPNDKCDALEDEQCGNNNHVEGSSLKSVDGSRKVDDSETSCTTITPICSQLHRIAQTIGNNAIDEHERLVCNQGEAQAPHVKGNSSELHRIVFAEGPPGPDISPPLHCNMQRDGSLTKETCDNLSNECIINEHVQNEESITNITGQLPKDMELHKDDNLSINCKKYDSQNLNERPISTCELPEISNLVIVERMVETVSEDTLTMPSTPNRVTQLWRRQSWSSSKDTSPSPERTLSGKQKHQKQTWYDEGELSNGALADSDTGSSDNTARLSLDDVNPVRSKISAWFDSFGKGGKKRNKERKARASSSFYSEDESAQPVVGTIPSMPVEGEPQAVRLATGTTHKGEEDSESENEDRRRNTISHQSEDQRKERKVFFIAQELMTSEKEFVDVLKLLNIHFSEAVNAAGSEQNPVIPMSDFSKIINGLPQLQRLNEDLLRDLENRIENWTSLPKIADVIVKKGPFLKLYSSYIQNFESQCNHLDDCCQRYSRFAKLVKEFEASPCCRKLNIKHFMLKPVQRIPQYRLLLEDYLRHLDASSPDFQDTEEALRIVRDVADHANRSITLGDHLSKLIELQSQLSNYEIIKPGRQFVKEGELFKLSRKGRHPRFFILLNDSLLYTYKSNTSLIRVNNELPLNGMKVNLPQVEDYRCEFSIISVTRSFTLAASSTEERAEWIDALENAIRDLAERQLSFQLAPSTPVILESFKIGQQAPVWIQDARVTMCQSCTTQFTVMFRRHHCRACGKVVCGVCSDNRAPLRYMRFQAARVCEECHDVLLQEFEDPNSNILQIIMKETDLKDTKETLETMKSLFKKSAAGGKKKIMLLKKDIPQRLKEVAANDSGSQMSGWLQRRGRRSWKRLWFVLKEQVLYVYKASEDVVALESIPVLGYKVEPMTERHFQIYEGIDARLVFQLAHSGQLPLVFHADTEHMANRWMQVMQEATVLM